MLNVINVAGFRAELPLSGPINHRNTELWNGAFSRLHSCCSEGQSSLKPSDTELNITRGKAANDRNCWDVWKHGAHSLVFSIYFPNNDDISSLSTNVTMIYSASVRVKANKE